MPRRTTTPARELGAPLTSVFEERAEYLTQDELLTWTSFTPEDRRLLRKLKGPGAKLLSGPRGSGKSTLLRAAYYELRGTDNIGVYVNYAKSLALEPLFQASANAVQVFRHWVLMKIVVGLYDALQVVEAKIPSRLAKTVNHANGFIDRVGAGRDGDLLSELDSPAALVRLIEDCCADLGYSRCVLLLDDAAHAFSPQQQSEFFEIFRELRTAVISPKAAVYPGITKFPPTLNVGHDAELIEAWFDTGSSSFLPAMHQLLARRLPPDISSRLTGKETFVDYLATSSFGLPRAFLLMLSEFLGVDDDEQVTFSKKAADRAVSNQLTTVNDIFGQLTLKMPRFSNFVREGNELQRVLVHQLSERNAARPISRKTTRVGFAEPLSPQFLQVLDMMEYAGILRSRGIKLGPKQTSYRVYQLHAGLLIENGAIRLGTNSSIGNLVRAVNSSSPDDYLHTRQGRLLGNGFEERCTLNLAPCQFCGEPRPQESAKFCHNCGRPLSEASVYKDLLRASVENLSLTPKKLKGIQESTSLKTVGDLLVDKGTRQLRLVPYIGPIWSERIYRYAEEYVSV